MIKPMTNQKHRLYSTDYLSSQMIQTDNAHELYLV